MNLVFVRPEEVDTVWAEVAPEFGRVVEKAIHGEFTTEDLYRLARDGRRGAISRKTNADAGADNTKTITDSSHDSSFVSRPTSCSSGDS